MARHPLLDIRDLSLEYPLNGTAHRALDRVNLTLHPGKTLGIIGESGCGKTSLAMAAMGLVPGAKISGHIRFMGKELNTLKEKERSKLRWKHMAMVFQNSGEVLNPVITIGEQIEETLIRHLGMGRKDAARKTCDLLGQVGLDPVYHRAFSHQLSGGMRQRVLIAMAIACDPALLIVDEPFTALDPASRLEMTQLLQTLKKKLGFAMILICHTLTAVAELTETTLTLYAGQVLETGPTCGVLAEPRHPYTRGLINACPEFYGYKDLWGIPGIPPSPGESTGCPFYPRCVQHTKNCATSRPPLMQTGEDRQVACHRGGIATVLAAQHLDKSFLLNGTKVRAVKQADLKIRSGEVVALVGPSGSGKSTLAHLLVALDRPDKGQVIFRGRPIKGREATSCMGGMQLVFQDPAQAVSPRLTVLEAVREPLDILSWKTRAARDEKVCEALSSVHLPCTSSFLSQPCHALSGGQRQRLSVARALVTDPVLLIADEITAMLDPSAQAHLLRHLKQLQHERGFSMLFISHDLHLARKIADRAYVLEQGRIVARGAGYQVFETVSAPNEHDGNHAPALPDPPLSPPQEGVFIPTYS